MDDDAVDEALPGWANDALSDPGAATTVDVDGRRIAVRHWGSPGAPGIVLVHGGAAHTGWWDLIGPALAADYRVAAFDLSGHGDSSHADRYDFDRWAEELVAVAEDADVDGDPIIVGHSMGALVGLRAAANFGDRISGVVVLDSAIREYAPEEMAPFTRHAEAPLRIYASSAEARRHFALLPSAPRAPRELVERLARHAIRPVDGGWTWKFDRRTFLDGTMTPDQLSPVRCHVEMIRGDRGAMPPAVCETIMAGIERRCPVHVVADAGHHVMVEEPDGLLSVLKSVLRQWPRREGSDHAVR